MPIRQAILAATSIFGTGRQLRFDDLIDFRNLSDQFPCSKHEMTEIRTQIFFEAGENAFDTENLAYGIRFLVFRQIRNTRNLGFESFLLIKTDSNPENRSGTDFLKSEPFLFGFENEKSQVFFFFFFF